MSELDDSQRLSELVIPGAHDAATGHGFAGFRGLFVGPFARTQSLNLSEQWDAGVRAFDLRPVAKDGNLPIYHGSERTKLTLSKALQIISRKLREHPGEVAIIMLRQELPGENWSELTAQAIVDSGLRLIIFSPDLTLGESRGGALILSRNEVLHSQVACLSGWRHDSVANVLADNGTMITVQDFYDCRAEGAPQRKISLMTEANSAPGWVINFLNGYTRARSAKSSREMSELMRKEFNGLPATKGIIMVDFVEGSQ